MATKRISVGILITPSDADIAAYLNSLRDSGKKPAKWLSGMLIANETGEDFPIPDFRGETFQNKQTTTPSSSGGGLLFGSGNSSADLSASDKWEYGWQVRGPHGEIVEGTVVSVSFCRPEVVSILNTMKENHLKIATYLKALMRHNMSLEGRPVTDSRLDQIMREYYLNRGRRSNATSQAILLDPDPTPSTFTTPSPTAPSSFEESGEKNPLLDYI